MQIPPITLTDVSFLLAVDAIILLIAVEIISPYYGLANLTVNKKKLKTAAIVTGLLFLTTVVIQMIFLTTLP